MACRMALKWIMTILLKRGCDPNIQDSRGHTPLHALTKYTDSKDLIQIYLDYSIAPVDLTILDLNMKQAIDLARSREVKHLLKKAKQNTNRSLDDTQF